MKKRLLDKFHLLMYALSIVGWATLFYSLLVLDNARPEMSTIITRYLEIETRENWLGRVYNQLQMLMWFCAIVSLINLALSGYLKVAYKERISLNIFLLLTVSCVAVLVMLIWQPMVE